MKTYITILAALLIGYGCSKDEDPTPGGGGSGYELTAGAWTQHDTADRVNPIGWTDIFDKNISIEIVGDSSIITNFHSPNTRLALKRRATSEYFTQIQFNNHPLYSVLDSLRITRESSTRFIYTFYRKGSLQDYRHRGSCTKN